jgi:hypothetical protein
MADGDSWRGLPMVGYGARRALHPASPYYAVVLKADPSSLDVHGSCIGMDQHQDHPCHRVLRNHDAGRLSNAFCRKRPHATAVYCRDHFISRHSRGPSRSAHAPTILVQEVETMLEFARELWEFLRERKKFWLLPIILFLGFLGTLIVLTEGSAVAPFIYTLF